MSSSACNCEALLIALGVCALSAVMAPGRGTAASFEGVFYRGKGDTDYLRLLDLSRRMFSPDPEYQNIAMLYTPAWNGFVEGPTWGAWWIQNSYGPTYCALPFYDEPLVTFLQNSQDLWFDQMGDGKGVFKRRNHEWIVPDGQLCDAASPGWVMPKQGDGRVDIHDWGVEFTAAGLLMQSELLLIGRDPVAIGRYLPKLERSANFLETRRDPKTDLFLAGPAGNLLAPSYAGWKKPDGSYGMAYLTGLSITYIAALDRLIELEKMVGTQEKVHLYTKRRDLARRGLPRLQTPEGYFVKSVDPDGTKHGVYGASKHGYFEAVCNHDAICFRVVDDDQAERIYAKIASIPGLRRHGLIITNEPSLDDMYHPPTGWLWKHGTWVNGGHWSTCEARMIMGYYRLGKYADARRSMEAILRFARQFRMDNPLVDFGNAVYQPQQPINLCYDTFGVPAAMIRGLFEYLYRADGLTLLPHIPPGITQLEQRFPVRFGAKRLFLATVGTGPVTAVTMNGRPWSRFDSRAVFLPYGEVPARAVIVIALGGSRPYTFTPPRSTAALPSVPDPRVVPRGFFPVLAPNDLPLRMGADSRGGNRFVGELAQPLVFARALTPTEVATLAAGKESALTQAPSLVCAPRLDSRRNDAFANEAKRDLPVHIIGSITCTTSPHGPAVRLTGDGYLELEHASPLNLDACTLAAWVRPASLPAGGARIIDKTPVGGATGYLLDTFPGHSLRLITAQASLVCRDALKPNRWTHVAATVSRDGALALYVNGKAVATREASPEGRAGPLVDRVKRLHAFYAELEQAGLADTYEAAHVRLACRCATTFFERVQLLTRGKLKRLPETSEQAADKSYLETAEKLIEGLTRVLGSYEGSADPRKRRLFELWRRTGM